MGLLTFIFINCVLVLAGVALAKKPREAIKDWLRRPLLNTCVALWGCCIMVAGWGVLTGERLSWMVRTPWFAMQSWKLAGLCSFAGLFILFVWSACDNHQHRKNHDAKP